MEEKSTDR